MNSYNDLLKKGLICMRINSPVTQQECRYRDNAIIISKTDRKGIIKECNKDFVEISGYDKDELVGQPHNILRHPDMPPAAFRDLWDTIKAGKVWNGIVKNRSKNGDFYWVEANATPIFEGGEITGYISVRTKPTVQQVQAANDLYEGLRNSGKNEIRGFKDKYLNLGVRGRLVLMSTLIALAPLAATLFGATGLVEAGVAALVALMLIPAIISSITKPLNDLTRTMMDIQGKGDLSHRATVHRNDEIGQVAMAFNALVMTFRGITAEVADSARDVKASAESLHEIAGKMHDRTEQQSEAAQSAAAAMEEMAVSIASVSDNTADVKTISHHCKQTSEQGSEGISRMVHDVDSVVGSVENISSTFTNFLELTKSINAITKNVRDIAEQTNLLALNAAIEAARAGESGRGFAVVADEVRKLAEKSAASANKIDEITRDVNASSSNVDSAIAAGLDDLAKMREYIGKYEGMFKEAAESVGQVASEVDVIASASREQASASNQVARNVEQIAALAEENNQVSAENNQAAARLQELARNLEEAVNRFAI